MVNPNIASNNKKNCLLYFFFHTDVIHPNELKPGMNLIVGFVLSAILYVSDFSQQCN